MSKVIDLQEYKNRKIQEKIGIKIPLPTQVKVEFTPMPELEANRINNERLKKERKDHNEKVTQQYRLKD